MEGIYLDREPEDDRTLLTGFIIYFRMAGRYGPYRVEKFTSCTMPFVQQLADSRRGYDGPDHQISIIEEGDRRKYL
tara:strand:- start:96 stop:323 length:228 start_codon:yes stop_codon:yes gene_type:complete